MQRMKLENVLNELELLGNSKQSYKHESARYDRFNRSFFSPKEPRLSSNQGMLPNTVPNYVKSPAAKLALRDGSLDPNQTFFNSTFNRKLKMKDSFTKVFPSYTHG